MVGPARAMRRDVYGLRIGAHGDWPEVVEAWDRDFAWFPGGNGTAGATVLVRRRAPDRTQFGPLETTAVTWRSAVYQDDDRTVVDYGRALAVNDNRGTLTIDGSHGWTVWRAGYDFLLARIDRHLDAIGFARVNGLGLAGRDGGVLVLLPSGGGKTTLALRALQAEGVELLSEGSPVLDAAGRLHPFPVPLLVRTSSATDPALPVRHLRDLDGIDRDPLTVEVSAFRVVADRSVPIRHVVLGRRSLAQSASLEHLPRRHGARELARAVVGGFGILSGAGLRAAPARLWATRARVGAYGRVLGGVEMWRLTLGTDSEVNWRALARLL